MDERPNIPEPQPDLSAYRHSIKGLVRVLASGAEQLEFQRRVRWVDISAELIAQWFDDLYHPEDGRWRAHFTECELSVLAVLNRELDRAVDLLPAGSIEAWQSQPEWIRVKEEATKVLSVFSSENVFRGNP